MRYAKCHVCCCEWDSLTQQSLQRDLDALGWQRASHPDRRAFSIWMCPRCYNSWLREWRAAGEGAPASPVKPKMSPEEAQAFLDDLLAADAS